MSSLIEQAARRLEQLRQAGVDMPPPPTAAAPTPQPTKEHPAPAPVVTSRRVELDLSKLTSAGIINPNSARSEIADQYRVIKRPLINNAMGKGASIIANGNLIMVTSALPGEGKSFTSINLAMSIATELDNTVMLVDADVARPSVMRMLDLPDGPGLLDLVLDDKLDMSSVLL